MAFPEEAVEFPFFTTTRDGKHHVEIIGYDKESAKPWYGFIEINLVDIIYHQPLSWYPNGHFISPKLERNLDIIIYAIPK